MRTREGDVPPAANRAMTAVPTQPVASQSLEPASGRAYDGRGFVVHEWGTNTVVSGSDGSLQRGLHHQADDLPPFVYDRARAGTLLAFPSVDKMETPVDYFYSTTPLQVQVRVDFPEGAFTEWYPAVAGFAPAVLEGGPGRVDPVNDVQYVYQSQACLEKYTKVAGGTLDWGDVAVLARDADVGNELPAAPRERFDWSFARDVAANAVRVQNPSSRPDLSSPVVTTPQTERFLFYRGIGNFSPPLQLRASGTAAEPRLTFTSASSGPIAGPVFVLNVGSDSGAFDIYPQGIAPGASIDVRVPALADAQPLDVFVEQLATAVTSALDESGLYHDEAVAMVSTWRRQWFASQGVRVLYFAPAAWIEQTIPMTLSPRPDVLTRVMVMRVELLMPDTEAVDIEYSNKLESNATKLEAEAYFRGLGRFAEPRLRRALAQQPGVRPGAAALLAAIETAHASVALE
jgi:hypothetical protein